jgi:hypothetical protein
MSPVREHTAMANRAKPFGAVIVGGVPPHPLKRHWHHPADGAFLNPPVGFL